jgi:hypothetical protein
MSRFTFVSCAAVAFSLLSGCAEDDAVIEVGVGTTSQALAAEQAPEQADESTAGAGAGEGAVPGGAASAARHVRITVKEIRVHIAGDGDDEDSRGAASARGPAAAEERADGAGWTTVFSGRRTINLSDHTALASILGSANSRPGRLTQVRLVLDGAAELVENGQSSALACPSCEVSGLKVINPGGERLEGGKRHGLLLAFDANTSIVDQAGTPILRPVIRIDRRR